MSSIADKVTDIVVEQLDVNREQVTLETSFQDDLGADSLDIAEIVMEFEDAFGVNIPDDETGLQTIGDVVKYIEERVEKNE